MADSEITIEITGLAFCFLKEREGSQEKVWNVAFLCDDHHPLNFYIDGVEREDWRPLGQDIVVDVDGAVPAQCQKGNFQKLLNLSHPTYGHGKKNDERSNLDIVRRRNVADVVWMRVPSSKMKVEQAEDTMIVRTKPDFGVPKRIADCGKKVKLTFKVPGDFTLILSDENGNELPEYSPIDIPVDPNGHDDRTLTFNNECRGCGRNDFIDIYEFVYHQNANGEEVQFMSWAEDAEGEVIVSVDEMEIAEARVQRRLEEGWVVKDEREGEVEMQEREFIERLREKRTSPYGNCDPVGSEPPPGP